MSLEQASLDGKSRVRLGHGVRCVVLMVERLGIGEALVGTEAVITLTPAGTRALADILREQADYSEQT